MPKRGPEHSSGGGSSGSKREPLPNAPLTLAEIGIDKRTSSRAQKLAALSEKTFAAVAPGEMPISSVYFLCNYAQKIGSFSRFCEN